MLHPQAFRISHKHASTLKRQSRADPWRQLARMRRVNLHEGVVPVSPQEATKCAYTGGRTSHAPYVSPHVCGQWLCWVRQAVGAVWHSGISPAGLELNVWTLALCCGQHASIATAAQGRQDRGTVEARQGEGCSCAYMV